MGPTFFKAHRIIDHIQPKDVYQLSMSETGQGNKCQYDEICGVHVVYVHCKNNTVSQKNVPDVFNYNW